MKKVKKILATLLIVAMVVNGISPCVAEVKYKSESTILKDEFIESPFLHEKDFEDSIEDDSEVIESEEENQNELEVETSSESEHEIIYEAEVESHFETNEEKIVEDVIERTYEEESEQNFDNEIEQIPYEESEQSSEEIIELEQTSYEETKSTSEEETETTYKEEIELVAKEEVETTSKIKKEANYKNREESTQVDQIRDENVFVATESEAEIMLLGESEKSASGEELFGTGSGTEHILESDWTSVEGLGENFDMGLFYREYITKLTITYGDTAPGIAYDLDNNGLKLYCDYKSASCGELTILIPEGDILKTSESCIRLFKDFTNCEEIVGLNYLDTSASRTMTNWFHNCTALRELHFI